MIENSVYIHICTLPPKILPISPYSYEWSKTILIPSCAEAAWADPPTSKKGVTVFMSLALNVPIFNKKSHRTQAVETKV